MKELLVGLAALAVVAIFQALFYSIRFLSEQREDELRRRLQSIGGTDTAGLTLLRQGKLSAIPGLDSFLRGIPIAERLELLIEQAQVGITVARLIVYSGILALVGLLVGTLMTGVLLGLILGAFASAIPVLVVYSIRESRSTKLSQQLPEALDMMSRSLRAGHALTTAFKLVATEMPSPVNVEFGHAFEEQNLGMSFDRAVFQMTRRAPNNGDLRIFAVSVIIQKETGGNLVEILEKIAETIRGRARFYGKLRTLTAEGRISAIVIGALPIVAGGAASIMNPEYMKLMVTTPIGQWLLGYAVVSWLFGLVWLQKMAKVEF
jgi:tight adherence protein B